MSIRAHFLKICVASVLVLLAFSACQRQPVRHYASDVSLLLPGSTTRQEVLTFLGNPSSQRMDPREGEVWIYHKANRSLLRRSPVLGNRMGQEHYEVITISFQDGVVRGSQYRVLNEQEFEREGLLQGEAGGS